MQKWFGEYVSGSVMDSTGPASASTAGFVLAVDPASTRGFGRRAAERTTCLAAMLKTQKQYLTPVFNA